MVIFDPTTVFLMIEEPENSVHPWIIRQVLEACRSATVAKQIVLTTHSPIVMNAVPPANVWVIWRTKGESNLQPLSIVDPDFLQLWLGGEIPTFSYIDSGAVLAALPPWPHS